MPNPNLNPNSIHTLVLNLTVGKIGREDQQNVLTLVQTVLNLMVKSGKWFSLRCQDRNTHTHTHTFMVYYLCEDFPVTSLHCLHFYGLNLTLPLTLCQWDTHTHIYTHTHPWITVFLRTFH
ncbi:hypothetical protein XENOCAPTIV_027378 [Xenoophorus captivus]|uniref:Uncharacterized protein n=1 Tax=Xenoophorus captivus TaxID=1517983 RepID=A0ABV0RAN0_9TELE